MSARDVIAQQLPIAMQNSPKMWAQRMIDALTAAGYRLIGPEDAKLIQTALEHASFALDGIVALDDEDMGKDGGSATAQHTKRTVDRALKAIRSLQSQEAGNEGEGREQFTVDLIQTALRHWPEGKAPVREVLIGVCATLNMIIDSYPLGREREEVISRIEKQLAMLRSPLPEDTGRE